MGQAIQEDSAGDCGRTQCWQIYPAQCPFRRLRAIVSDIPGTTRDTIQERLFIEGFELRLIDTAGLRENPSDPIEAEGIRRTRKAVQEAFLTLIIIEAPRFESLEAIVAYAKKLLSELPPNYLLVANKSDLVAPHHPIWSIPEVIKLSARQGMGLEELKQKIAENLTALGASGEVLISNYRHYAAFTEALAAVQEALGLLDAGRETELVAQAMRRAAFSIGTIIGEITPEDIFWRASSPGSALGSKPYLRLSGYGGWFGLAASDDPWGSDGGAGGLLADCGGGVFCKLHGRPRCPGRRFECCPPP